MAWYDAQATGALATRISSDIPLIQEALGDKVGTFVQFAAQFIAGFGLGFSFGWKLTLVIVAVVPLLTLGGIFMSKHLSSATAGGQGFYAEAGQIADEVLRMIRTVIAFNTQDKVGRKMWCLAGARAVEAPCHPSLLARALAIPSNERFSHDTTSPRHC